MRDKPQPRVKIALDYHECRNYLHEKYNYDERNFAGWKPGTNDAMPYQDFWHWLIEKADYIANGCYIWLEKEWIEDLDEDDFRTICLTRYFDEFGNGEDSIEFWVEW